LLSLLDLIQFFCQTARNAHGLVVLIFFDITIQVDWICILNKDLSKLSLSLVDCPYHQLGSVQVSKLTTDHLVCKIMGVKNPVTIDADWYNLNVVLELLHIIKRLKQNLDSLV
jgi:hypothetical protein